MTIWPNVGICPSHWQQKKAANSVVSGGGGPDLLRSLKAGEHSLVSFLSRVIIENDYRPLFQLYYPMVSHTTSLIVSCIC